MADLTAELPIEKLSEESWVADKAARKARMASRNPANNSEKSLFRQMAWCNTNIDHMGDLIRDLKNMAADATPDANNLKYFNENNKRSIVEKLRAAAISNNNNSAYLRLAKDFDYAAADEFEDAISEDLTLDETTSKKLDKVAKKYAAKSKPHPYSKGQSSKNANQSFQNFQYGMHMQQPQYGYPSSQLIPQQPQMIPQQPQMMPQQPQMMPQQQLMFPQPQTRYAAPAHQFPPMQGVSNMQPLAVSGRGRGINKTYSTCKVCKGLGHWLVNC